MSYCTLMEAWGVDSFKSKKKASCSTLPSVAASAEAYDPFNPEASGREVSGIAPTYTGPMPSPPQPQVRVAPSGRMKAVEQFEASALAETTATRGAYQEKINKMYSTQNSDSRSIADKTTYRGQANDYTYACQNYGICAPVEPFQDTLPPVKATCGIPAPTYQYPLSPEEKKRIQTAIEVQNREFGGSNRALPNQVPPFSKKPVEGYVDEELEDYLSVNDLKATPATKPIAITPVRGVPEEEETEPTPYEKSAAAVKNLSTVKEPPKKETVLKSYYSPLFGTATEEKPKTNMFDILIYIATGILLILLLEQLYRLAVLIGMQQTVRILEPYLAKLNGMSV